MRLKHLVGELVIMDLSEEGVNFETVCDSEKTVPNKDRRKFDHEELKVQHISLTSESVFLSLSQITSLNGGRKANGARQLEELSRLDEAGFNTPPGIVIPFGVMEKSLHSTPDLEKRYHELVHQLNDVQITKTGRFLIELQNIIKKLEVPHAIVSGVMNEFAPHERLIVRSSTNYEDLEKLPAAGLYDSIANIPPAEVADAVRSVWASLWTRRAALSRRKLGIPHENVHMSVLVQKMIVPEFSFIMHTMNPVNYKKDEIYIELAAGLGETLATGRIPGTPYRIVYNKNTEEVQILSFASLSCAIWPDPMGGTVRQRVDYSKVELSRNETALIYLGSRLGSTGRFIENVFGYPQDIEGCIAEDLIYLFQSRPQQGIYRDDE